MSQTYEVNGEMTDSSHVTLDQPIPVSQGRVRVIVEPVGGESKSGLKEFMEQMWEAQRRRGHVPRTKEQIDAELNAERNSWDR